MNCPNGHGPMPLKTVQKKMAFRDAEISIPAKMHVCSTCKLEAGTIEQTAQLQQLIQCRLAQDWRNALLHIQG